jgi:autotransporter-associated beta strand protein
MQQNLEKRPGAGATPLSAVPNPTPHTSARRLARCKLPALLAGSALALLAPKALADSGTWVGGTDATWANALNWSTSLVPGTTDTATFNAAASFQTLDLGTGASVGSIAFDSSPGAYTIGSGLVGSQTLTLAGTITMNSGVSTDQKFNANVAYGITGANTIYNWSANTLTLAGTNMAATTGIKVIQVDGTGNTVLGPMASGAGSVNLEKLNTGTLTLTGGAYWTGNGVNEYVPGSALVPVVLRAGTTILSSGNYTNNGEFTLGGVSSANGTEGNNAVLTLNAARLVITNSGWFSLGRGNGIGTVSSDVILNNGSGIITPNASLGFNGGTGNFPKGSITLNDTSSFTVGGTCYIGESVGANMTVTLNGASCFTNTSTTAVNIGRSGAGSVIMNGAGTFFTEADAVLSYSSSGVTNNSLLQINGGVFKVASGTKRWLQLGRSGTSSATLIVNGGTLQLSTATDIRMCTSGSTGTNTLTLKSGAINFYADNATTIGGAGVLDLQNTASPGAYDIVNLDGGTLTVSNIISANTTGTRVFCFNGGTLKPTVNSATFMNLGAGNAFALVRNGGAIIDSNGKTNTIAQPLLHSTLAGDAATDGGLSKNGNGMLTLAGLNTYTGPTVVNAGVLVLGGGSANSQSITVADAATLGLANASATQWAPTTMTLGSSSGAILNLVVGSTAVAPLKPATLTLNGANTLNITGGNFVAGASYPLIAYTTLAGSGSLTLGTLPSGVVATLSTSLNTIYLNVSSVAATLWTGAVNGTWDTATANWSTGGTAGTYTDGSLVRFDDTGAYTTTITNVSGALSPSAILVTNATKNYALKTVISGSGGITKSGSANLTNAAANTYSGPTVIGAGVLVAGAATVANASGPLGVNSAVTLSNDSTAVLNLNGNSVAIGSLTGGGPNAGNVTLGSGTLTVGGDSSSPAAYAGNIAGSGGLTKVGFGTLTVAGTNLYTGQTIVNAGTLTYASGAVQNTNGNFFLGTASAFGTAVMNVNSGSTVKFGGTNCTVGYLTGTGLLNLNGGAFVVTNELRVGGSDVSGPTPTGSGTVVLNSGVANLGSLTVARGNNNMNSVSGTVLLNGGVMFATNDSTLGYAGVGSAKLILNGGTFNMAPLATKWFMVGYYDGTSSELDITNGSFNLLNNTSVKMSRGGNTGGNTVNQNGGNVTFYSDAGVTVGGTGNWDMCQTGSATSTNTYNLNGGTLTVPQIISTAVNGRRVFNFNGGTLQAAAASPAFMNLGSGDTVANVRNGGAVIDSNGKDITIAQSLYHSSVDGDNAIDGGLTKRGNGTLTFTGTLGYNGPTRVLGGALSVSPSQGLPSGSLAVTNASLALNLASVSSWNPSSLALNGTALSLTYGTISANPSTPPIQVSGGFAYGTTNTINISGTGFGAGLIPLITVSSGTISTNGFVVGSLPAGLKGVLTNSTSTELDFFVTSAGQLLSWRGASQDGSVLLTNWDINTSTNWYDVNNNSVKYLQYSGNTIGDNVIFGDNAVNTDGTNHVYLSTTVVPATVTFSSGTSYVIEGPGAIGGATALVLTNTTSYVYLNATNTYTGGTLVASGTLVVSGDAALGAASTPVTLGNATLQIAGGLTNARTLSILTNSSIGVSDGFNARLNGSITAAGQFSKIDTGTLTLGASNSFTGNVFVRAGTMVLDGGSISNATWDDVGYASTDSATLTLKGTGSYTTANDFNVGDVDAAMGVLNVQDTATLTAYNLMVGSANNASSTASGTVNQTGGTVFQTSSNLGAFVIGGRSSASASGVGVYNLSGGTLISSCGLRLGCYGTGTVNQTGGLFRIPTVGINLARFAGAYGNYYLSGGTLETYNVASSTGANAMFYFNGGTLLAAAAPGNPFMSGLTEARIQSGGAIIDSGTNAIVISQSLLTDGSGGGLIKKGSGTLTLSGANTYTGTTIVTNGELFLTPAHQTGGAVVVADSAAFGVASSALTNSPATIGALTLGNAAGSTLDFTYGFIGNPTNAALTAGAVTLHGNNVIHIGGSFGVGAFPVLKYSSLTGDFSNTVSTARGMAATVSNDTAHSTIYVVVTSLASPIVWTGTNTLAAKTNVWDLNTTTNWLLASAPTTYQETLPPGDAVLFNDTGSGLVLLSNTASPSSVTFTNNTVDYTVQGTGQINSTAGLTKTGSRAVTLNVPGNYYGNTAIAAGTVTLGTNQTFGNLSGAGVVTALTGAPALTVTNSSNSVFTGSLQGTLGLTKTGNGTLVLSGSNGFAGNVFGRSGAIVLDSGIINGGTQWSSIGQSNADNATLTLRGAAAFTNNADFNVGDIGASIGTLNVSNSSVLNVGSMYVASANALGSTASGTVNQAGGTVQNQYLVIGGRGASTNAVGVYNLTGGSLIDTSTIRVGGVATGTLNISGSASASITGTGINYVGFRTGIGSLNMTGGTFSSAGEIRVGGSDVNGATNVATGSVTLANATMNLTSLTVARGNYLDNACSGTVTLNSGSTLISTNDVILQFAGSGTGKLVLNGGNFIIGPAATKWLMVGYYDTGAGEIDITNGNLMLDYGTSIKMCRQGNTGANVINHVGGNVTFYSDAGVTVGGGGALDLNYAGASGSSSTYNLLGGTLTVPQVIATSASGSGVFNFGGGTLKAAAGSATFMQGLTAAYVQAGGAVIDSSSYAITIAQPLVTDGNGGGLVKLGSGTLYLNGTSDYTGNTVVSNGVLAGIGTLASPVITRGAGALGAGSASGVGTLTVNNNVTLQSGASLRISKTGGTRACDLVSASGAVTYGGTLTITDITSDGTLLAVGDTFTLFQAGSQSGSFSSIVNATGSGAEFSFASGVLTVTKVGPATFTSVPGITTFNLNGNNVVMTVTNGQAGCSYYLLMSTNVALPINQWRAIATNVTAASGTFTFIGTNAVTAIDPQRFYRLSNTNYNH